MGIKVDIVEVDEKDKAKPWQRSRDQQRMVSQEHVNDVIGVHVAKRLNDPNKSDPAKSMKQPDNDEQQDEEKLQRRIQDKHIISENPAKTLKISEKHCATEVKQQSKEQSPQYDQDQKHLTCKEDVKDSLGEDTGKTIKKPVNSVSQKLTNTTKQNLNDISKASKLWVKMYPIRLKMVWM